MKILYLVTLSEPGGAQRYIRDLAAALPPGPFAVAVAAGGQGTFLEELKAAGIATYRCTRLGRAISPLRDVTAIAEIRRLLTHLKPDVLHLNSSKAGVLGALAARGARVGRVIYTAHGFVFNEPLAPWRRAAYRWLERQTAKYKNRIICVSEHDRQTAISARIAPAEKLVTIHNGIDPGRIHFLSNADARQKLQKICQLATGNFSPSGGSPEGRQLVGTIANFYPTKGLGDFLQAAALVVHQLPNTRFLVIGDGPERPALERLIHTLGIGPHLTLTGRISDAATLLPGLSVYCSTSLKEGLPYSILEAMAAARPIVVTAVGGVPEMISSEREGLLVPPGDPPALAAGIIRLLQEPAFAARLGAAARRRVEADFTLTRMVELTLDCYRA